MIIVSSASLIDTALKVTIFKDADKSFFVEPRKPVARDGEITEEPTPVDANELLKNEEKRLKSQRQRSTASSISFLIVSLPVFWYHRRRVKKEKI